MADVDTVLVQQIFYIAQREREPHIHQNHQADHLERGIEAAERAGRQGSGFARHPPALAGQGSSCHVRLSAKSAYDFTAKVECGWRKIFVRGGKSVDQHPANEI